MLTLQDEHGLLFWKPHEVASLVPEHLHRQRAVHADGTVAHTVGQEPFTNPRYLTDHRDPAGFLPQAPQRQPEVPEHDPILYVKAEDNAAWWHTDTGLQPAGTSAEAAAKLHPHLIPAGRGTYVNPRRLHRLTAEGKRFRLTLDTGEELTVSHGAREPLRRGLKLASLYTLDPSLDPLYKEGLRDWPYELATAPAATLQRDHHDLRRLIANQVWQAYRQPADYGTDHRGFWYVPLAATLQRAGFLRSLPGEEDRPHDPVYLLYLDVINDLVGRHRLLTFEELGFRDPRPDLRHIGDRRPDVVLIAEKSSLELALLMIQKEGVSTLILGGLPSLLSTEYFARALNQPSVTVFSAVDFDPGGWVAAEGFCQQLTRYGVTVRQLTHLVTPDRFTAQELELYSFPLKTPTPAAAGKVAAWLEKSGGIDGQARGMHADHLRPPERLLAAFQVEVADRLLVPRPPGSK